MTARTFVDTNVLVYAVDTRDPAKQRRARTLLTETDPDSLVVSAQVLNEYNVTVTRKLAAPLDAVTARRGVLALSDLEVVPTDRALIRASLDRVERSQLSLWDALIVEAARSAGCEVLLTEDLSDTQHFDDLEVVNPFRALDS